MASTSKRRLRSSKLLNDESESNNATEPVSATCSKTNKKKSNKRKSDELISEDLQSNSEQQVEKQQEDDDALSTSQSPEKKQLTQEELDRIESNRQRALQIRAAKQKYSIF